MESQYEQEKYNLTYGTSLNPEEILKILKRKFRDYIGEEKGVGIIELIEELFPDTSSVFQKYFYADVLKRAFRKLRSNGELFIICKKGKYFVLQTQNEAEYYKNILDRDIKAMENSKLKADEWVEFQKWRRIK